MSRYLFYDRPLTFWGSIQKLIGHLVGAGVLFSAFFIIVWGIAALLHWLNTIYAFPPEIFAFITRAEVWFMYIDIGLCMVVVVAGAVQFLRDLWSGMR